MKYLDRIWPWSRFRVMQIQIDILEATLEKETADKKALVEEVKAHQSRAAQHTAQARKMAQIIALKGGIIGLLLLLSLSVFGQALIRNPLDTNSLGNAIDATYFLGWDAVALKPKWVVPAASGGVAVAQGTNIITTTNGSVVTVYGLTDTNMINVFMAGPTNFTLLIGANATNNDNLHAANNTNFSLLIGLNATNNDANSTNFGLLIGVNATNNDNLHAANNTNFSLLVGANATNNDGNSTNFSLLIGSNATNDDQLFGVNATNHDWVIGANDTNQTWLIGLNATNNDANSTNFALLIGANATNHDTVVSNGITPRLIKSLGITIDGGGSAVTSGTKGYLEVPCACTIISATILSDQTGNIAIETWRTNSASMPPTRVGALFTNYLTAAQASIDSTLTGNTSLSLAAQDRLGFNVTTNSDTCTRITLQLRVQP
jgi:hypothetical protein